MSSVSHECAFITIVSLFVYSNSDFRCAVAVLIAGNLHKWAFVPRGCAVLWVHPHYQRYVFPTVTSRYKDADFDYNFSYQGTDDNSQYYTAKAALQFSRDVGGHVSSSSTTLLLRTTYL